MKSFCMFLTYDKHAESCPVTAGPTGDARIPDIMWVDSGKIEAVVSKKKGSTVGILALIVLGLIAGLIAKFVMPGNDPGGLIVTILIGIAGAFIGGFISSAIGFGDVTGINIKSIVIAAIGAFVLLFAVRMLKRG